MNSKFETPFDNIESAQEYLALLSQALDEAQQTAEGDIVREANSQIPRRRDALRLVLYKLEKLEQHIRTSRRLLNDLRTLRRLLLEERAEPRFPNRAWIPSCSLRMLSVGSIASDHVNG